MLLIYSKFTSFAQRISWMKSKASVIQILKIAAWNILLLSQDEQELNKQLREKSVLIDTSSHNSNYEKIEVTEDLDDFVIICMRSKINKSKK